MSSNPFERLTAACRGYASLPILEAFNWPECLAEVEDGEWYIVAFRSVRRETADPHRLKQLDDLAYEEALTRPGLLLYFRGVMNERRECLSICVWESQESAREATRLPSHQAAAQITDETYTLFELERWVLTKVPGSGRLEIRPVVADPGIASRYASAVTQATRGFWLALDDLGRGLQLPVSEQPGYAD